MVFPRAEADLYGLGAAELERMHASGMLDALARHPSQLYQFALEGLLLFTVLWLFSRRPRPTGMVSGAFLAGYGVLRFVAEYFREPDSYLGLLALNMSMGQWLCVPMVIAGIAVWVWAGRRAVPNEE